MPPIPFQPSHKSPFKSTLSTSQQGRRRSDQTQALTGPATSQGHEGPPSSIDPALLNPDDWTLLAEGAKNLLLRYKGPSRFPFVHSSSTGTGDEARVALRIPKRDRGSSSSSSSSSTAAKKTDSEEDDGSLDALQWRRTVIEPLLAPLSMSSLLPPLFPVVVAGDEQRAKLRAFLDVMASRIEVLRKMERRKASGIDTGDQALDCIWATQDLSAGNHRGDVYAFEIKPKCGFRPQGKNLSDESRAPKTQHSRYKMHRILKQAKGGDKKPFSRQEWEGLFDPLDLFSGQSARVDRAIESLWSDWKQPSRTEERTNLCVFRNGVALQPEQLQQQQQQQHNVLFSHFRQIVKSAAVERVLKHLVELQHVFDQSDIEGVAKRWQEEIGTPFGVGTEHGPAAEVMRAASLAEYAEAVQRGLHRLSTPGGQPASGSSSTTATSLRQDIVDLLLSAMWKDCSLFLRSDEGSGELKVHLVDLDPKSIEKLRHWKQLDEDVVAAYKAWSESLAA
ncbi:hypothetical protein FA10DRAFT_285145 [Acaromyces ingoldii]|uniref:Inositol-pentakisphosphate 2-kinase n=1 Tax=Acaromyces ingoldii TaxID=215250 RepID=A0A316YSQ0_9BASI|nr:hypothetical protein FA10DRAFT_285145 [Acaromyces ingoldii]PWN92261.1 hypothetical protein FA10DRAFT_285145 [Acaromyces ingoldii]